MKNNSAFTLIELIVGITLSIILMVSVSLFVSSGLQNLVMQQKVVEEGFNISETIATFQNTLSRIDNSFTGTTTTNGFIFKIDKNYSNGGFMYLGTETLSEAYCDSGSESTDTEHVFLKTFIPFEEDSDSSFDDMLLSKVVPLSGRIYQSDYKNHQIIDKNTGDIVVGKGIFGDSFTEGASGTGIYLNSPTGLVTDGTNLFISDTLNNRVLYLDASQKIHLLLDETDGLSEPTGLYYNDSTLYIANSGRGEILSYSSKTSDKKLNLEFVINTDLNDIRKVQIKYLSGITNISEPNSLSDFQFTGINKNAGNDYLTGSTNIQEYYFSNFGNNYSTQIGAPCSGVGPYFKMESGELIKETFDSCSGTGTLRKSKNNNIQNISSGSTLTIQTSSDTNGTGFGNNGNYYTETTLFGGSDNYKRFDYLFTQSDGDITTKGDNTLSVLQSGLNYPTGIRSGSPVTYNEFNPGGSNLEYSEGYDSLLGQPIESFSWSISGNMFSSIIKYNKVYNCYNPDEKSQKTILLKKDLN